ncbi:MAG: type I-B CRISPR-associated protein Cas7/Cst2/DevR [Chloroflexota bacterium]|nr:type I-B CRISPR-associated protein Cas7/Cst2/DevR [Chloroflexota bacterium]
MAYITALLLIDASASALNNSGEGIQNARTDNTSGVKFIRKYGGGLYPYATAQAYRRWLRDTLEADPNGWRMSPIHREEKVAYVDANPIQYWDDDLLGYMRAPGKKNKVVVENMTPMGDDVSALTRMSPLRVSTLVSVSPVNITNDFGVMARQEGDPVPYEHQFYRATLQGLLSLDMARAGVFTYSQRTGYQNLDSVRRTEAEAHGLEHLPEQRAYRLPTEERLRRIRRLIQAIPLVQGGAKQTLHYTDVTPAVSIAAVTRYGNHPFNYLFEDRGDEITFNSDAFATVIRAYADQFLSPVYVGWRPGYATAQYNKLFQLDDDVQARLGGGTPGVAFDKLSDDLADNPAWLDA